MSFVVMQAPNSEIVGIQCAKAFGSKDYKLMRVTFLTAIFTNYFIFLMAVCIFSRVDLILISIGMNADVSQYAHKILLLIIPGMFLQTSSEVLENYIKAMGILKPFFY